MRIPSIIPWVTLSWTRASAKLHIVNFHVFGHCFLSKKFQVHYNRQGKQGYIHLCSLLCEKCKSFKICVNVKWLCSTYKKLLLATSTYTDILLGQLNHENQST